MLITAADTYELEDKSRGPVQLAFDSYHRPPAALGARKQDFLSLQNDLPFAEKRLMGRCVPHLGDRSNCLWQLRRAGTVKVIEKHRAGPLSIACTTAVAVLMRKQRSDRRARKLGCVSFQ